MKKRLFVLLVSFVLVMCLSVTAFAAVPAEYENPTDAKTINVYAEDVVATDNEDGTYSVTINLVGALLPGEYMYWQGVSYTLGLPNTTWMATQMHTKRNFSPSGSISNKNYRSDKVTEMTVGEEGQEMIYCYVNFYQGEVEVNDEGFAYATITLNGFTKADAGCEEDDKYFVVDILDYFKGTANAGAKTPDGQNIAMEHVTFTSGKVYFEAPSDPVITASNVTVNKGSETAADPLVLIKDESAVATDGTTDLTSSIVVDKVLDEDGAEVAAKTIDTTAEGSYTVTLKVTDPESGLSGTKDVTITISNPSDPTITATNPEVAQSAETAAQPLDLIKDEKAVASDGTTDLTSSIVVDKVVGPDGKEVTGKTVNTKVPGTYTVTLKVTDSVTNLTGTKDVTITVKANTTAPVITASEPSVEKGTDTAVDPLTLITDKKAVGSDGKTDITSSIVVDKVVGPDGKEVTGKTVNTTVPGEYSITLKVVDPVTGNIGTKVVKVTVKTPSVPPVVTPEPPQTGDTSNVLWIALMAFAVLGICGCVCYGKYEKCKASK